MSFCDVTDRSLFSRCQQFKIQNWPSPGCCLLSTNKSRLPQRARTNEPAGRSDFDADTATEGTPESVVIPSRLIRWDVTVMRGGGTSSSSLRSNAVVPRLQDNDGGAEEEQNNSPDTGRTRDPIFDRNEVEMLLGWSLIAHWLEDEK